MKYSYQVATNLAGEKDAGQAVREHRAGNRGKEARPESIPNMKEHSTMLLKIKGLKNRRWEHPTISMKTHGLFLESNDVDENRGEENRRREHPTI